MSGIIIGNLTKRNGAAYNAKVAIGGLHYDYLRDAQGVAELRLNPQIDYYPLNSANRSKELHLEFSEPFANLTAYTNIATSNAFSINVENINGGKVTAQDYSFPMDRLIYMSDKPLALDIPFFENSGLSLDGGPSAGTFLLIANKGNGGTTLYWTSTAIDDSLQSLIDFSAPPSGISATATITRIGTTDFFTTQVIVSDDILQRVASVEVNFDSWTGTDPVPTELPITTFTYDDGNKDFSNDVLTFNTPADAVGDSYDVILDLKDKNGFTVTAFNQAIVVA